MNKEEEEEDFLVESFVLGIECAKKKGYYCLSGFRISQEILKRMEEMAKDHGLVIQIDDDNLSIHR